MYQLGYYPANGTLVTKYATVTFDASTGYGIFSNLVITKHGMYLTTISVYTDNSNDFNFNCYSNPIQIRSADSQLVSYDSNSRPDYIIKFNGSYNSINPSEIKASVYNFMISNGIKIGGISCYSGSVYVAFYSSDTNSNLINKLINNGLIISSSLSFVSATIGGVTYICSNCTIIISNSSSTINYTQQTKVKTSY